MLSRGYIGVSRSLKEASVARPICLIVPLLALMLVSFASAQIDPVGAVDSVVVTSTQAPAGSGFVMTVRLVNDEPLTAWSLPLHYDNTIMTLDSIGFAGTLSGDWTFLQTTHNAATGQLLIGAVTLEEDPIAPGGGILARLHFRAAPGRDAGDVGIVDTAFVPPGGTFVLTAQPHANISPAYVAGKLTIIGGDQAPVFAMVSSRTVREGDNLALSIEATDPEGVAVRLAAANLPAGAKFTDSGNGAGLFEFTPPYAGPGSAARGPYKVMFSASDGIATATMPLALDVVDVNRAPVFAEVATLSAGSGDTIEIPIVANDPDFDPVVLTTTGLPAGAEIGTSSPTTLRWESAVGDSGSHQVSVLATDDAGATSTQSYSINLAGTTPAFLTLGDGQADNGKTVDVSVSLYNRVEVASLMLLIRFDPTLVSLEDLITESTRLAEWDRVESTIENSEGLIWLEAECDTAGGDANVLPLGDGEILTLHFRATSDYGLAGYYSPLIFEFIDTDSLSENYLYQADGVQVTSTQLEYTSGGVMITAYEGVIGDLNLNDVPFEVADYVYFMNYFTDPLHYPLDGARWPNSDINQNGQAGELDDLIYMEEIMSNGGPKLAADELELSATSSLVVAPNGNDYQLEFAGSAAAVFCKLAVAGDAEVESSLGAEAGSLRLLSQLNEDTLRVLILRPQPGLGSIPLAGKLFTVAGSAEVELVEQVLVDARARRVALKYDGIGRTLPEGFNLSQNHPNPFNPETNIEFALPQGADVSLTVYNVLGREVRLLQSGWMAAGQHQVRFDGRDDNGAPLASGVYFYRLRAGTFEDTRKMVLLK